MKKLPSLLAVALLCFVFTACQDTVATKETSTETLQAEKETVTLGVFSSADDALMKAISMFNLKNQDYKIQTKQYESLEQLRTQLMSGKGPDLYPVNGIGATYIVAAGLAENLQPYLDQSERLAVEDLQPNILELSSVDNILVSIPSNFSVSTLIGAAAELGNEPGWTTEAFLSYVDANRGRMIFSGGPISKKYLIWYYLWSRWDELIDYSAKKACFDTPDVRNILDFALDYEDRGFEEYALLESLGISSVSTFEYQQKRWENDMVIIGFPTSDGTPRHGFQASNDYAINKASSCKEGAWAFIEYLLLNELEKTENDDRYFAFPTYLPALEAQFEKAKQRIGKSGLTSDGTYLFTTSVTEEDIEQIKTLLNSISYKETHDPAEEIVYEEIAAFLAGGKTIDETIDIIQNRVQLYLDEMN